MFLITSCEVNLRKEDKLVRYFLDKGHIPKVSLKRNVKPTQILHELFKK